MNEAPPQSRPSFRLTVPLFDTSFTERPSGPELDGRTEVAPDIVIARLDEDERARILRESPRNGGSAPIHRLEIHIGGLIGQAITEAQAEEIVRRTLGLLSCTVRFAPRWHVIWIDRHEGDHWIRERRINHSAGGSARHSYVPLERIRTWGRLLQHWPLLGLGPVPELALHLYAESVAVRQTNSGKAFLLATVARECLLGSLSHDEDRTRRGVALTLADNQSPALAKVMGSWNSARDSYLGRGQEPPREMLVPIHRFLMRALPSTARLMAAVGGDHSFALEWLDALGPSSQNHPLAREGGDRWWDYVPLGSILENGRS